MTDPYLIVLRVTVDGETGDQGVTLSIGGTARGGCTEARWGFSGGLDTVMADDIRSEVMNCLSTLLSHTRPDGQLLLM